MTSLSERMPPLRDDEMDDVQRNAAAELIAGPRKGVKGPFIPLLRSPELMARLQKVGEYLRFDSAVPRHLNEFVTLIVSRHWSQEFEWATHAPLATGAGIEQSVIDDLREGRRPEGMTDEVALAYDFTCELIYNRGVCEATYEKALLAFGSRGLIDMVAIIGYFTGISMILNVAHTPPETAVPGQVLDPLPR